MIMRQLLAGFSQFAAFLAVVRLRRGDRSLLVEHAHRLRHLLPDRRLHEILLGQKVQLPPLVPREEPRVLELERNEQLVAERRLVIWVTVVDVFVEYDAPHRGSFHRVKVFFKELRIENTHGSSRCERMARPIFANGPEAIPKKQLSVGCPSVAIVVMRPLRLWGTFLLLCALLAVTGAGKRSPLDDLRPVEFSKKPPPPTIADFHSLREGQHATSNAALNAVAYPTITGLRCVSVLDPQLLEEDLDAVERSSVRSVILDEYVYYSNPDDETALCDELLVPFEFEDAWFLAWYKRGKLNFLAEEDLVEEPIGKKVAQAVRMLYSQRTITSVQHYCEESSELRKLGDGAFLYHQAALILTHEALPPRAMCNGKLMDPSTGFLLRIGLLMRYPAAGRKHLMGLPEPEFDKSQPDQVFMLKLANGFKTRTFSDGKWGPEIDFEETFVSELFNRCIDRKASYRCHEYLNFGSLDPGSINLANGIIIDKVTDDDLAETWFCAHSWDGYGHDCLSTGGESCFRVLSEMLDTTHFIDNQDAFVCKRLPNVFISLLHMHIKFAILPFLAGAPEGKYRGAFIDMDNDHQVFSALTRLKVILQRPHFIPESYREHRSDDSSMLDLLLQRLQPNDVYTQLANSTGEVFMVMAKNDPKGLRNSKMDADGFVLNVLSSLHPLFANQTADDAKLAFNAPKDKVEGPFWVCLGDYNRESESVTKAGGTYCIQDEALNRDLRCSSVVGPIVKDDPTGWRRFVFADIEEIPYEDWYSDCPKTIRDKVIREVEHILRNPEEYHSAQYHFIQFVEHDEL